MAVLNKNKLQVFNTEGRELRPIDEVSTPRKVLGKNTRYQ